MTATENGQTTPAVVDEKAASHPSIGQANNEHDVFLVDFAGQDDPYNPVNWSLGKKMVTTLLWALTTCWIAFASAVCSAGIEQIVDEFHVNHETAASGVSLMIFGFAFGPMLWAPLGEVYNHRHCFDGIWIFLYVPICIELPRRHIYPIQRQCHCCKYLRPFNSCWGVSTLCVSYVFQTRG